MAKCKCRHCLPCRQIPKERLALFPTGSISNLSRKRSSSNSAAQRWGILELLRHQLQRLAELIDADSTLLHRRFPELDCGSSGARRVLLQGATLLHVAAEFGNVDAAKLLLDRGADVNAHATVDEAGVGGQTAIFHAVTQFVDRGFAMTQLLVESGADL